ncbi:MAG: alpha/beta hydrolase [Steroidobacteraceae bacterium]|jgi:pimeloyl-ACP methyl ester carboxylesterase|nr:alpha/beta hydrolase [Steroidobacteraceae bacterium]
MSRHSLSQRIATLALASVIASSSIAAQGPGRGTSIDDWKGYTVLKGGKGYVQAPLGQLHYRDVGPREAMPLVLLHQSPMSMIQWADVQNELVRMGHRVITVDTPGNGLSDIPDHQPTIEELADNLVVLLDGLKLKKVLLGGHHTGAQIATAFTARHPGRVQALVLHGAAMFSDEQLARYQANIGKGSGTGRLPQADGSNFTRRRLFGTPGDTRQELLDANAWLTITSYLTGPDLGHYAAFHYRMKPDLMKVRVPTLLLSDTGDEVNPIDKEVARLRPDFEYVEFSNGNFMEFMTQPRKWALIVDAWLKRIDRG